MNLHFMLDLETMATGRDAAILSIGAVRFDPQVGEILDRFYRNITLASNKFAGREINPQTVEWWLSQSKEAQDALLAEPRVDLQTALYDFRYWMLPFASDELSMQTKFLRKHGKLWSCGPTFDEVIIRDAFAKHTIEFPLSYQGSRDCRTTIEIAKALGLKKHERGGEKHNALDDAVFQAEGVIAVFKEILK